MFTIYSIILQRESQLLQIQCHIQRIASLSGRAFHQEEFLAAVKMVTPSVSSLELLPRPSHVWLCSETGIK